MNDTQFDAALDKLQHDFDEANTQNHDDYYYSWPRTFDKYLEKQKKILNDFKEAKHRLYEERSDAQIIAKRFTNGTDSLTVRDLVKLLNRYEDEFLENSQRMNDDILEHLQIMPRTHYHVGVASTFGTMFGMFISFLVFIVIKKFKHRNDPEKYTLF